MLKTAVAASAAAVLAAVGMTEGGWPRILAITELAALGVLFFWLAERGNARNRQLLTLTDDAILSLDAHRDYAQRVSDVNGRAVIALSEHDEEAAVEIARDFLDAYAIYREHVPSGGPDDTA
jgi:hypothetical protein